MKFQGTYTALVTPFRENGSVDEAGLSRLLEHQIAGGVSGVVLFGSTGEGVTLTRAEREAHLARAVEVVDGRIQLLAGVGGSATAVVADEARAASALGVDGLMVSTPPYNKPNQAGLRAHFTAVADASSVPVMVYDIPGRTAAALAPETTLALAEHPRIRAIKEAAGLAPLQAVVAGADTDFAVLVGDDDLALPAIALGAVGLVSVVSNQAPELTVRLVEAALAGEVKRARELHYRLLPLIQANFAEPNPIPVKAGLAAMGLLRDALRLPLVPASDDARRRVVGALDALGLLRAGAHAGEAGRKAASATARAESGKPSSATAPEAPAEGPSGGPAEPASGNVAEPASGNVAEPASGNVAEPASGNVAEAASGNVAEAASASVREAGR